jgi:hypothetical protein
VKDAFNPDLFVAKWYCSEVWSEELPAFAADALEAGYDGPALRRLGGLIKPTSEDIGDLFQRACDEIGTVKILSQRQAVYWMSRVVATDIVEGRIDPVKGAGILAGYARLVDYAPVLAEFLELGDIPYWGEYAPPRAKLIEDIIEEARMLLANVPG